MPFTSFYSFISPSAAVSTISDITIKSASTISIGYQHIAKIKKLNREGYKPGLIEVNVQGSCLIEIDAFREAFGFARDVIGSTRRCTIKDKFVKKY